MGLGLFLYAYGAALLLLLHQHGVMAFTYWVDPSCDAKPEWSEIEQESFRMARRAANRLSSTTDWDFANVFQIIFGVAKHDSTSYERPEWYRLAWPNRPGTGTAYDIVHSTLKEIGQHTRATGPVGSQGMTQADIRITCDNGAGWTSHGNFYVNNVHQVRNEPGDPAPCQHGEYGETFTLTQNDPAQQDPRSLVVLCDRSWQVGPTQNPPSPLAAHWSFANINPQLDLSQLPNGVQDLHHLVSITLLHEITHTRQYEVEDYPEPDLAYGWRNVYDNPTQDALWNSDNYAYLGLFALLADRRIPPTNIGQAYPQSGYTLWRPSVRDVAYRILQNEEGRFRSYTRVSD